MQRYKSKISGDRIDVALERALPGGKIDLDLSEKADILTDISPGVASCDDLPNGLCRVTNLSNAPVTGFNGKIFTSKSAGGFFQHAVDVIQAAEWYRVDGGGGWGAWTPFATATPPTEYDLPLASGYTTIDGCTCFKTQDSVVTVIGNINHTGGFTGLSQIAELPIEYRPAKTKISSYGTYAGGYGGGIIFYPNGVVCLAQDLPVEAIYFSATFAAAN